MRPSAGSTWTLSLLVTALSLLMMVGDVAAQNVEKVEETPPGEEGLVLLAQGGKVDPQRQKARRARRNSRPAQRPTSGRRPSSGRRPARAAASRCPRNVETPIDIGIGPAAHFITGQIQRDQLAHIGGRLSLTGVMTEETMSKHWDCFPAMYKRLLGRPQEVRAKPIVVNLIPAELIVSPKFKNTAIYGVGWNLIGFGLAPISGPVRFDLSVGLPVKYMYIDSDTLLDKPMHFFRPGLQAGAELEFALSRDVLFSLGWISQVFIPQRVGGKILELGKLDDSIWHIGQAFVKLHLRFPYESPLPR